MNVLFYRRFNLIWSTLHSVREILLTLLATMDVENDDIDNTGLVVTEYLTNLIRHSEGEDEAVTLVIGRTLNSIKIELIDPTSYFHPTTSKDQHTDLADGELREGGMGLALIEHYFPDFRYFEKHGKNHFSFALPLKKVKNRVVIIDDEHASLQLVNAYLERDYDCHAFTDEHQAYQYLMAHNVDLLLIDMNLNAMLADEFISNIKQLSHLNNIGIVVISGDGSRETMLKAHLCGVDDYLVKPVKKEQLEIVCERVKSRCVSRSVNISKGELAAHKDKFELGALSAISFGNVAAGSGGDVLVSVNKQDRSYVFFGDVMGHGESANRVALQLKGYILGLLNCPFDSLADFVNGLAKSLPNQDFMQQSLVTFIALEISERHISLINAGHPLPIVLSQQQIVTNIGNSQPLLGLDRDYEYHSECYQLEHGHSLVMATDGLFENHENCFELQQLVEAINTANISAIGTDLSQLWYKCLPRLSKEIDDSSLLVLN
ncbi:MAG: SpoIIE family protein phosphatase [Pseudoalteromonas spongiae]